jgi:short subunit dehydrogenase-like uncharacterized protein
VAPVAGRIALFGATGYTGRLTAEALVARGERPLLAGRNEQRVRAVAEELGGLDWAAADVGEPESVRALVDRGDVLISTVGPFVRFGETAVQAAIARGAHYLDSTGEPSFVRAVFERYGNGAEAAGCGLLTAFGNDWVPGNLAGALALREAGDAARRVEVAYYATGRLEASGGTRASAATFVTEPGFAFRGGRVVAEPMARRVRSFDVRGRSRPGVSVGGTEHYALPRVASGLQEVDVYLGWFGAMSRPLQVVSLSTSALAAIPGFTGLVSGLADRVAKGSTGGPDAESRARSGSHYLAIAKGASGETLAEVHLEGPNAYTVTGDLLAWGAATAARGGLKGSGALGPVDGFGLDVLERGCAELGLRRV